MASAEKTVAFDSGLHGWGSVQRRWVWTVFNAEKKTWTNVQAPEGEAKPLPRAFYQFIMGSISQLMTVIMNGDFDKYDKMMGTLGIAPKGGGKQLTGKPL